MHFLNSFKNKNKLIVHDFIFSVTSNILVSFKELDVSITDFLNKE